MYRKTEIVEFNTGFYLLVGNKFLSIGENILQVAVDDGI